MVTSNHNHLLVEDRGEGMIPRSIQLIAGRTAQSIIAAKEGRGPFGKTVIKPLQFKLTVILSSVCFT